MSLIDTKDNPIPDGAVSGFLEMNGRVKLRYAHWPAAPGKSCRGTVTILQGRAEFIEKYYEVVSDLRSRGYAVVAFDWRGQGGSTRLTRSPARGHVTNFKRYQQDLLAILKNVSLATYPGPHFALAHSTGGLILMSCSQRLRTMLDRAVITAPLLAIAPRDWESELTTGLRKLLRILTLGLFGRPQLRATRPSTSRLTETLGFGLARFCAWTFLGRLYVPGGNGKLTLPFEENRQTTDRQRYRRFSKVLEEHPEIGIGSPTMSWLNAAATAMKSMRQRRAGPEMRLPCLILGAGRDRIVSTPAIEEFVSRTKNASYIEISGAEHELLMEADRYRDQVWAAFDAFVPGLEADLVMDQAGAD
ncbi:alpha/beta hydrolase [Labrenzia sp. R4_1]|uniref:alpha/beta fold hydrolase n=1 Tax=Labrenzia sp. R4_1 TaxID=2821106 RepID=UPI001ADA02A5|nr:alpha/beta hydrolase [Labrenzia sp. R4_1]MBO9426166.1 alpha/beta hydrolase [Labrenzia sp. R4_1]